MGIEIDICCQQIGWMVVQVYFMLMFINPILNKRLENLSEKEWKLSLFLLSVISFYLGWALHNYNDGAGYTLMNFVYIYVISGKQSKIGS